MMLEDEEDFVNVAQDEDDLDFSAITENVKDLTTALQNFEKLVAKHDDSHLWGQENTKRKTRSWSLTGRNAFPIEELEEHYKELKEREKDYQLAVHIGKMLLEKNNELQEENNMLKQNLSLAVKEDIEARQSSKREELNIQELKIQLEQAKIQVNLLQNSKRDSELKILELADALNKNEEHVEKLKKQLAQLRQKQKVLSEESENYKAELEQLKDTERKIRRSKSSSFTNFMQRKKDAEIKEDEKELVEKERLEDEIAVLSKQKSQLEALVKDLKEENAQFADTVSDNEDKINSLNHRVEVLSKSNQMLQQQHEEEKHYLEVKAKAIAKLESEVEEGYRSLLKTAQLEIEGSPVEYKRPSPIKSFFQSLLTCCRCRPY